MISLPKPDPAAAMLRAWDKVLPGRISRTGLQPIYARNQALGRTGKKPFPVLYPAKSITSKAPTRERLFTIS